MSMRRPRHMHWCAVACRADLEAHGVEVEPFTALMYGQADAVAMEEGKTFDDEKEDDGA